MRTRYARQSKEMKTRRRNTERRIHRSKKNITQQYEVRNNIELKLLHKEPDIAILQYRRITWAV